MDYGLEGKAALVTGTASQKGMAKAISLMLAKEGCDIVSCDIDLEGATQTADEVKALGRKASAFKTDVSKKAEVGEIEAIYHGNPGLSIPTFLDYKALICAPSRVVVVCNGIDREFNVWYSAK